MKKIKQILIGIFILITASTSAQTASTATTTASATIVVPLILEKQADLSFGTISTVGGNVGTVVINAENSQRTVEGVLGLTGGQTPSRAFFKVGGTAGCHYAITVPNTVQISNGTVEMNVTDFTIHTTSIGILTGTPVSILDTVGVDYIGIGATLNVGTAQPAGFYQGTFEVQVDYN